MNIDKKHIKEFLDKISKEFKNNLRIAFLGDVHTGKSAFLSNIINQKEIFYNHPHDKEKGHTSSIAVKTLCFNKNEYFCIDKDLMDFSKLNEFDKIITFLDLCGKENYKRTNIFGISSFLPHFIIFFISLTKGITKELKKQMGFIIALKLPFFFIFTKTDLVTKEEKISRINELSIFLKINLQNNLKHIENFDESNEKELLIKNFLSQKAYPLFTISNKNFSGIKNITKFIYQLKIENKKKKIKKNNSKDKLNENNQSLQKEDPVEFNITNKIKIKKNIIIYGLLKSGKIQKNGQYLLGPFKNNEYKQIIVKSINFLDFPVDEIQKNSLCTLAISSVSKNKEITLKDIKKGILILDSSLIPTAINYFEAEIAVLSNFKGLKKGCELVMNCGVIRQKVKLMDVDKEFVGVGDKRKIFCKFVFRNEFLKVNSIFLLSDKDIVCVGFVTNLIDSFKEK